MLPVGPSQLVGLGYGVMRATGGWDKLMAALGMKSDVWTLRVCDEDSMKSAAVKDLIVVSQYPPENMKWSIKLKSGRTISLNDDCPPVIPLGGEPDGVTFSAQFNSESAFDDLTPTWDAIELFARNDSVLGRRPVLIWTWGKRTLRCILSSLDIGIPHGHHMLTGFPRDLSFEISLEKSVTYGLDYMGTKEKESIYHTLAAGETPELVAWRYLGDPMLGVKIRQLNDQYSPEPGIGARLKVLEATHSKMRGAVRPRSAAFGSPKGMQRFEDLYWLRMHANGIAYDDWPTEMK
jgi:hypothetical protein